MQVRDVVREFILQNFYVTDPAKLADDASLVDLGIVDSTGILEVIAFLEDQFRIKIEDHETVPENLESIARIAAFVAGKCERVSGVLPAAAAAIDSSKVVS